MSQESNDDFFKRKKREGVELDMDKLKSISDHCRNLDLTNTKDGWKEPESDLDFSFNESVYGKK